jgi:hypothetical protein
VERRLVVTFHAALRRDPGGRPGTRELSLPLALPEPAAVSLRAEAVDGWAEPPGGGVISAHPCARCAWSFLDLERKYIAGWFATGITAYG